MPHPVVENQQIDLELKKPLASQPTYVDADGDGDPDAVMRVEATDGIGWLSKSFVWLWDAKQEKAIQQPRPLHTDTRCAWEITEKIAFDGQGQATVSYKHKPLTKSCGDPTTTPATRTLDVKHRTGPFQSKPWPSSLDSCTPAMGSGDVFFPANLNPKIEGFRSAPSNDAPVIVRRSYMRMWNAADRSRDPKPGEWFLVWYMPKAKQLNSGQDVFPCGWAKAVG